MSDYCKCWGNVQLLQDVVLYATEKQYKDGSEKNWKQSVRKKADRFKILNGELLSGLYPGGLKGFVQTPILIVEFYCHWLDS